MPNAHIIEVGAGPLPVLCACAAPGGIGVRVRSDRVLISESEKVERLSGSQIKARSENMSVVYF